MASGVSSDPRVTGATIAGQMPPDGCFNPLWKRRVAGGVTPSPRDPRYLSIIVPCPGEAPFQIASAISTRLALRAFCGSSGPPASDPSALIALLLPQPARPQHGD